MNALTKALSELRFTIPQEVLQIGFVENFGRVNTVTSLDERILNSVIRPRVMIDANIVGGVMIKVPVIGCTWFESMPGEVIIDVPKSLTMGRSIVTLHNLICNVGFSSSTAPYNTTSLVAAANNMYTNLANHTVIQTGRLELIGDNTVLVQDPSIAIFNAILRCTVENESNMENLHPRFHGGFAKLVTLAVKSYIYNNCKVKLDQGYVYGGHELGSIGEIIDTYSDAEEQYQEYLNTEFRKLMYMNQSESMNRLIKAALGNTL